LTLWIGGWAASISEGWYKDTLLKQREVGDRVVQQVESIVFGAEKLRVSGLLTGE